CRAACAKLTPCATPSRAVARRTRSTRSLLALASCSNAVCSSARKGRSSSFCGVAMSDLPSAAGVSLRYPLSTNQLRRDPLGGLADRDHRALDARVHHPLGLGELAYGLDHQPLVLLRAREPVQQLAPDL